MCEDYAVNDEHIAFINQAKKYYETILKKKVVYINVTKYFKILAGKNQGKKMIREIVLFHFPILGYMKFAITRVPKEKM